tara:strand:- start:829 stop:996 length:168 start_codon:yes stop_codon:yes gene_type:complete
LVGGWVGWLLFVGGGGCPVVRWLVGVLVAPFPLPPFPPSPVLVFKIDVLTQRNKG